MKKQVQETSRIKKTILMLAIALVFVFFIGYAVQTILPAPQWDDYCGERMRPTVYPDTQEICESLGGKWTDYGGVKPLSDPAPTGWCDIEYECRQEYEEARETYENRLFYFNILLGITAVIISFFLTAETVSAGVMAGGVINLVYGSMRNWQNLPDIFRTGLLGIALAALIWMGYKKLK